MQIYRYIASYGYGMVYIHIIYLVHSGIMVEATVRKSARLVPHSTKSGCDMRAGAFKQLTIIQTILIYTIISL